MKTWNDYKEYVKKIDPQAASDIKEAEEAARMFQSRYLNKEPKR